MTFPALPNGYRWKVSYNQLFGIPEVVVKIKGRFRTHARSSNFPTAWGGVQRAADRAAGDAFEIFQLRMMSNSSAKLVAQFESELNR